MSFHFIEHTADIAVEINAASLEELFTSSGEAWQHSVLEKVGVHNAEVKELTLIEYSAEELLVSFLQEINFLLFTRKWIYGGFKKIEVSHVKESWRLTSVIIGENFNEDKHELKEEIKAVTFHQMNIEETPEGFKTRIVFDI